MFVFRSSPNRCFTDREYISAGVDVREHMEDCDILLGIKEVPFDKLITNKTYLFFHIQKNYRTNQLCSVN